MSLGHKTLDDLLKPISERLGHDAVPSAPAETASADVAARLTDGLSHTQLVDMFAEEAAKVRVDVRRCSADAVHAQIADIVASHGGGGVVMADDPRIDEWGIADVLATIDGAEPCTRWQPSLGSEANVKAAEAATFGITFPVAALAETGTVVQPASDSCGRAVSLLPLVHVAIVDAGLVMPRMADFMRTLGSDGTSLPSQVCFISGPSATADIELVRVEGVHGPMYVHYIIVE